MKNLNFPTSAELSRQVMRARADHHQGPESVSEFYARVMARGCVALDEDKKRAEQQTQPTKKVKK